MSLAGEEWSSSLARAFVLSGTASFVVLTTSFVGVFFFGDRRVEYLYRPANQV